MRVWIAVACAAALTGQPVIAQQQQPPRDSAHAAHHPPQAPGAMPGQPGMMMRSPMPAGMMHAGGEGMMRSGGHGPMMAHMLVQLREPLGLSEAQVQQLHTIAREAAQAHEQHMHPAMQAHHAAMQALHSESPDVAAYEARLREAADHHVQAEVAGARALARAMGVLSPEQRGRFHTGMQMMHHMMGGMMGGMHAAPSAEHGAHQGAAPRHP